MIKQGLKFSAMLLLGFLTGCTGKGFTPSSQQAGSQQISIVSDSKIIYAGGTTTLTITARNRSNAVMDLGRGSSSCWFGVQIVNEGSGQSVSFSRACTRDYVPRLLEPGEDHSEVVTWRARMREKDEIVNVPPGEYKIIAVANGMESPPITLSVRD